MKGKRRQRTTPGSPEPRTCPSESPRPRAAGPGRAGPRTGTAASLTGCGTSKLLKVDVPLHLGSRAARGTHSVTVSPNIFISLFSREADPKLSPSEKKSTNSTNIFFFCQRRKSFIYLFFSPSVPVRRFGAGGGGWESFFFSSPGAPLCV